MITGYNTEVKRKGRAYHVQTEDKGVRNPIIETLVYVDGGQIIHAKQYDYRSLVAGEKCDEKILQGLLESQHRRVMRWITGGKFDEEGPPPFGSTIVSGRSFDEVVLEFIRGQSASEAAQTAPDPPQPGSEPARETSEPIEVILSEEMKPDLDGESALKLIVRATAGRRPVAGAAITVTLNPRLGATRGLATGTTGEDGRFDGVLRISREGAGGVLQVEARSGGFTGALEIPLPRK